MATRTATTAGASHASLEAALLARLGLPAGASPQEVEVAHDGLVEFLEGAPGDLRGWARRQIGAVDEAYALLSDPTIDRSAGVDAAIAAGVPVPAIAPGRPVSRDTRAGDAAPERRAHQKSRRAPEPAAAESSVRRPSPVVKRLAILAATVVGVVAIAVVGFNLNGGTGIPPVNGKPDLAAAASPAIDTAKVTELMQKIQANPKDTAAFQSLADIYYQAGDFESAGGFLEKVLSIEPKNVTARLALGAVLFNLRKPDGAEEQWRQVLTLEPDNVEAHYDLGFMFLSETPPDVANARIEWGKVIQIAPDSEVARTVATHLASLDASAAPGGSGVPAGASGAPAGASAIPAGAGPSSTPAPSASPAASAR